MGVVNPSGGSGAWTKISEATTTATTTITFSSIPSGYRMLMLCGSYKISAVSKTFSILVNNDNGANQYLYRRSFAASDSATSITGEGSDAGSDEGFFYLLIYNTSTAFNKGFMYAAGKETTQCMCHGYWKNSADEINRLDVIAGANFEAGGYMALYGAV